jgi:hypothetical protein
MAGCKLAVIVVEGGAVQSTSSGTCVASAICIVDVTAPNFSETFTAIPDNGWYFIKWNSGGRFFCGGSTNPECNLSFEGHEETEAVQEMVDSSEMFYLMPIFALVESIPSEEVITADGKEWAQVDLFTGLSWEDINAVCSADTGVCSGVLNGYDVTGWTWASVDEVNALFNFYIGSAVLGRGPDLLIGQWDSIWAPTIFDNGWRPTIPSDAIPQIAGATRSQVPSSKTEAYEGAWLDHIEEPCFECGGGDVAGTSRITETKSSSDRTGAWFYRKP